MSIIRKFHHRKKIPLCKKIKKKFSQKQTQQNLTKATINKQIKVN